MIEYKVSDFTDSEIRQAVAVQIQELSEGFLSSLGVKPLELIFRHAALSRFGIFVLVKDEGQVVGYVLGSTDTRRLYKEFLIKRTLPATAFFLPKLFSRQRLKKALETLAYPTKKRPGKAGPSKAELLDLAILRSHQGSGIAQKLFGTFANQCADRGVRSFQIPTSASLGRAHRFYVKVGARRVDAIQVHSGQLTYIYQFDIKE